MAYFRLFFFCTLIVFCGDVNCLQASACNNEVFEAIDDLPVSVETLNVIKAMVEKYDCDSGIDPFPQPLESLLGYPDPSHLIPNFGENETSHRFKMAELAVLSDLQAALQLPERRKSHPKFSEVKRPAPHQVKWNLGRIFVDIVPEDLKPIVTAFCHYIGYTFHQVQSANLPNSGRFYNSPFTIQRNVLSVTVFGLGDFPSGVTEENGKHPILMTGSFDPTYKPDVLFQPWNTDQCIAWGGLLASKDTSVPPIVYDRFPSMHRFPGYYQSVLKSEGERKSEVPTHVIPVNVSHNPRDSFYTQVFSREKFRAVTLDGLKHSLLEYVAGLGFDASEVVNGPYFETHHNDESDKSGVHEYTWCEIGEGPLGYSIHGFKRTQKDGEVKEDAYANVMPYIPLEIARIDPETTHYLIMKTDFVG